MAFKLKYYRDLNSLSDSGIAELFSRTSVPIQSKTTILCPSKGMITPIKYHIAARLGICMGVDFSIIGSFAVELTRKFGVRTGILQAHAGGDQNTSREALRWFLYNRLQKSDDESVRRYIGDDEGSVRRCVQLADALDEVFQNYLIYRHEMLLAWEEGVSHESYSIPHTAWQRAIWREINTHDMLRWLRPSASDFRKMLDSWAEGAAPQYLPHQIHLFAVGQIPPLFLRMLKAASQFSDVAILLPESAKIPSESFFLSQMNTQSRNLAIRLADLATSSSVDPSPSAKVPYPLYWLPEALARDSKELTSFDTSAISIHSCHSRLRELEVLRDAVLDYLEVNPSRTPRDILVVAPDLQNYAPLIHAVFGRSLTWGDNESTLLPYHIAEQPPVAEDSAAMAFAYLVRILDAPLTASGVIACFDYPSIRKAAELEEEDLAEIAEWVRELHIHVGLDENKQHSWRRGLDRLLLGYAMGSTTGRFHGLAPFASSLSPEAECLGKFARYLEKLFSWHQTLSGEQTLSHWSEQLLAMVNDLLVRSPERDRHEWSVLEPILQLRSGSLIEDNVPFEAVRYRILEVLEKQYQGRHFESSGILFCSLSPMRAVSFDMIAILGLSDRALPRRTEPTAFNLMAAAHVEGDPNRAEDDRQSFLDHLLAARSRLHLSYVGRSQADNAELPPSICLSEFQEAVPEVKVYTHRLQPFAPEYYKANAELPRTFDTTFSGGGDVAKPFCQSPIPLNAMPEALPITELIEMLSNPSKAFCRRRLDIHLPSGSIDLPDSEYLSVDKLMEYKLKEEIVFCQEPGEDHLLQMKSSGKLPMHPFDDLCYQSLVDSTLAFREKINETGVFEPSKQILIDMDGLILSGTLKAITSTGSLRFARPSSLKAKDYLEAWVWHLAASLSGIFPGTPCTNLIGLHKKKVQQISFLPVENPRQILGQLLEVWEDGMSRPLPLFPKAAFAYAGARFGHSENHDDSIKKAKKEYYTPFSQGDFSGKGDWDGEYHKLCFRDFDHFQEDNAIEDFSNLCTIIYQPLYRAMAEGGIA